MLGVAKTPKNPTPAPAGDPVPEQDAGGKKKRHVVFLTLDDIIEARLQRFIDRQRIKPDRAAVGLTALIEFLEREEAAEKNKS